VNDLEPSTNQIDAYKDRQAQILLKEYELCLLDANHLEDTIWTVTGILITASVAGIGFLGSSLPKSMYDLLVRLGVAILSLTIIYAWNRIVMRLYSIQQVLCVVLVAFKTYLLILSSGVRGLIPMPLKMAGNALCTMLTSMVAINKPNVVLVRATHL
jgi:hypothetical protein